MNQAFNIDCVAGMKQMEDSCVDLTVTSPPYDELRDYKGFTFNYKETLEQLFRITKNGGVVVWIVADQTINGSESGTSFRQALYAKEIGFNLHDTMIWNKGSFSAVGAIQTRYAPVSEYMFIFTKGAIKTFNPIKDKPNLSAGIPKHGTIRTKDGNTRKASSIGKRYGEMGIRYNVWEIPPVQSSTERTGHPAQFPVRLAKDHIVSWSNEGDTVLDPFLGSGTTRIAAYDMNRNFIGFEISKEYYDLQEERFRNHTAQTSLFV